MSEFTYTAHPVYDRSGRQVGVDRIRRYVGSPPSPEHPKSGTVNVFCACGETYLHTPHNIWAAWGSAVQFINGQCNCKAHFGKEN